MNTNLTSDFEPIEPDGEPTEEDAGEEFEVDDPWESFQFDPEEMSQATSPSSTLYAEETLSTLFGDLGKYPCTFV